MSNRAGKNRTAFRPSLDGLRLEDRVVLTTTVTTGPFAGRPLSVVQLTVPAIAQTGVGNLTLSQIRRAFSVQAVAAQNNLRQAIRNQVSTLFSDPANLGPNGRPTAQALANFRAGV